MRILQINAVYGTKSTGRTCKELHDWAVAQGHEVLTVYGNGPRADVPASEAVFLGTWPEHKVHAVTARIVGDAGIGSWRATRRLLGIIRRYRPDVIHLRNLHGNFVHIPMLLRYIDRHDIPTVVQLDDCFWFTGGCMHYTANGCDAFTRDCRGCRHLRRGHEYVFANPAAKNLARKQRLFGAVPRLAVEGVSRWTAAEAARSAVFGHTPIIDHVYNWIDLDTFAPRPAEANAAVRAELGIAPGRKMLLGVASGWGPKKGLDDFMALRRTLPEDYEIVLVGDMDAAVTLPAGIMHIAATESVTRLADLYSAADVFVHLSREETFGKVTAEALACGTPAVVYNSTASPELVDAATGAAVTPGDIPAVAAAITRLTGSGGFSPRMSSTAAACRARAAALFSLPANCARQLALYQKTIALPRR